MIDLLRFIWLENLARRNKYLEFKRRYSPDMFGEKYQILADILNARMMILSGKNENAEVILRDLYRKFKNYRYFNIDTRIYISNYIYHYTYVAHGILSFRINPKERPLNHKKVNRYIKAAFFHNSNYDET